jgi:hypothetical protein
MAEKTISHLIEVTKQENAESRGVTQEVASEVGALAKMFGKYFQELKNNAGDRQEEKQEEKAPAAGVLPDLSTLMSDTKGMGIFGIIAGITAAIAGLAVGIVEGFARAAKLILSPLTKTMVKMVSSITKFMLAPFRLFVNTFFPDTGKKLQNQFNRIRKVFTNGIARIAKRIEQLKDWAKGIGGRLAAVATNIRQAFVNGFQSINAGIRGIAGKFRKLTFIENAAKLIGKLLKPFRGFVDDIKQLKDSVTGAAKASGDTASKIKDTAKKVKKVFTTLKQSFGGFFKIFRTLGRVVLFPLTIIMTMVDAFKGFKEGFASGGLIGGVIGAISGVLKGLIGMPLDLIKSAVSWIAGKLGFENFSEMLDSFSFTELIGGLFNTITDSLLGVFDAMKDETGKFNFGEMIKVVVGGLLNTLTLPMRMMINSIAWLLDKIPLDIAKSGASALRSMSSAMTFDTGVGEATSARQGKRADLKASKAKESEIKPNAPQSSDRINEGTKEVKASEAASGGGNLAVQNINAPTTTNNSQSSAVYGDASPATDDLDRVAFG